MGYYIEAPSNHGKAEYLVRTHGGERLVIPPATMEEIPEGKALIVVIDNMIFEAAGFAHDQRELDAFTKNPRDPRPREYVIMDRALAEKLSGFSGDSV